MVDVGNKVPTLRIATARSYVVFPPEVMSAFRVVVDGGGGGGRDDGGGEGGGGGMTTDMIGPKGPIFEIAKIAGIMGAK
jgi:molybdenum cofactor biosynthesis enzyme